MSNPGYSIAKAAVSLFSRTPFAVMYVLSDILAFLLYHVIRYRRKVVRRNLTECFPDKSTSQIAKIEKGFYRNFTDTILEMLKLATISPAKLSQRMRFPNIDEVNAVLHNGRSIGLFLGHYANWEWISSMPLHLDKDAVSAQIYHRLNSPVADRLIREIRSRMGAVSVEMRSTARFITHLATGGRVCIVGFIADQAPRKKDIHYRLEFLNHLTPVMVGTEKLVKHYDMDAWFVNVTKVRRGYYEARFVHMADNTAALPDFELTDTYYRMLADMIRRDPRLYLWSHKRFRSATLLTDTPNPANN